MRHAEDVLAGEVLMVRPANFGFNAQTAGTNAFQAPGNAYGVLAEFDGLVDLLDRGGITVHLVEDTKVPVTPDALFPNNWVSFHEQGAVLYPMMAPNRRLERRLDILERLGKPLLWDMSHFEDDERFLEGTGSLVLDRGERFCFACVSPRTDRMLAFQWCQRMDYRLIDFETHGPDGSPVYHTNVVGSIGEGFAVVCRDVIVEQTLLDVFLGIDDYTVIELSMEQMGKFCGNILHLRGSKGPVIAMSDSAWSAFTKDQRTTLGQFGELIVAPIPTIERIGGGSVRCMLAEVY